jgi:ATP-binding cassette subfamily B protein/ATP-binding cassette subfamily C protein
VLHTAAVDQAARRVGLRNLLPYLRPHLPVLLVVAALSLASAVGSLAQPLLIRSVLDGITAARPVGAQVSLLVALLLGVAVLGAVRNFLLQRTAEGLVLATRQRLAGHLLRLPIAVYDRSRTGDLLSRVGADTTMLRAVVTSGLLELGAGLVVAVGAVTAMVLLDPLMFLVTMVGFTALLVGILVAHKMRGVSEQAQARVGEMTSSVERALSAVRTIRASRAEAREASAVARSAQEAYAAGVRMAKLQALMGPVSNTALQVAFLLVLGVGGARVASGAMSVGDLVAFVMFLFLLMMPLAQALGAYARLQTGLGALQRIENVLGWPDESHDDPPSVPPHRPVAVVTDPLPGGAQPTSPAVEFDNVSFSYPGGGPVLDEVSFVVPYGTRTALVGPSGAGKSTLLALVERFYDITGGSLRVAGVDLRDQPRDRLRSQIGYVEQHAPVLAGTLRDNLLLSAPEATQAQLLAALAAVNLGELVERSPDGLDVQVGEGGVLLSGGQCQRLALARILLVAPPILLLDEPTSNLDARNEAAFRRAIDVVAAGRTMLLVAHRLSTVIDADQIVVIEHGRVVASGSHRHLTETSPLYQELATCQLLA